MTLTSRRRNYPTAEFVGLNVIRIVRAVVGLVPGAKVEGDGRLGGWERLDQLVGAQSAVPNDHGRDFAWPKSVDSDGYQVPCIRT